MVSLAYINEDIAYESLLRSLRRLFPPTFLVCLFVLYIQGVYELPPWPYWPAIWHNKHAGVGAGFEWDDIEPSRNLQYHKCFDGFQCARLSVPLNWNASTQEQEYGPRVAIAIIKLPAKVSLLDDSYGGPIIVNPGGPGESGINQVLNEGRALQTIVDSAYLVNETSPEATEPKYFDIISFDPRGVNNTTPRLRCFPDAAHQNRWLRSSTDYGLLWDSEAIIGLEWARQTALGQACSQDEEGILRYANTAQVVEDMVEIIEREGEWRGVRFKLYDLFLDPAPSNRMHEVARRLQYQPGQEKLQYWGVSYGTLLGATFAAMHPDRVKRMVLDGVMDPADYYSGSWLKQLQDANMIITKLSEYCYLAGFGRCAMYSRSSAREIETRFTSALMGLKNEPFPLLSRTNPERVRAIDFGKYEPWYLGPDLITYGDVHLFLLAAMYYPLAAASLLFDIVAAIERRDASSGQLIELVNRRQSRLDRDSCERNERPTSLPYVSMLGHTQSIGCMDSFSGLQHLNRTVFREHIDILRNQSRSVSPNWARNKLQCLGHAFGSVWQPDLDFATSARYNTAHALLVIGNSHDPVTPLANARTVHRMFSGSGLLHQNSQGHTSMTMPSLCTGRAVRNYFQTGALPAADTVCEPEQKPFVGCNVSANAGNQCRWSNEQDRRLWEAMSHLADPFGLSKNSYVGIEKLQQILKFAG